MTAPPRALVRAAVIVVALHGALLSHFSQSGFGKNVPLIDAAPQVAKGFLITAPLDAKTTANAPTSGSAEIYPAMPSVTAAQATTKYPDTKPTSEVPAGYLRDAEVDKAAELLGEWVINTEPWNDGQVVKIAIRILISAQGRLERWEMSDGSAPASPILQSLVGIDRTVFQPAMRAGKPVASQRDVELIIYKD